MNCNKCGERIKVVESYNKKDKSTLVKTRCSNPLCSLGKHWMPGYKPEASLVLACNQARRREFIPPDKITAPVFKNPPPPEALDIHEALSSEPLTWQPVERDRVRSKITPTVAVIESVGGRGVGSAEPFYVLQVEWSREFPVGHIFSVKHSDMMSCWEPLPQWKPQVNQWVRHKKTYRCGCINHKTETLMSETWSVRFTDMEYPVDLTTEELVANYEPEAVSAIMNPPAPKPLEPTVLRPLIARERELLRKQQMEKIHELWEQGKVSSEYMKQQALCDDLALMQQEIVKGMQVPEKYLQGNYSSSRWAEEYYKKSTDLEHLSKTLKKLAKENGINIFTAKAVAREGDLVVVPPVENRFATTAREENKKYAEIAKKLVQSGRVSSSQPNEAMPPQEFFELTISGLDQNDNPISEVVRVPKGGGTVVTKNSYKTYSFTPPCPGDCKFTVGVDPARGKDETVPLAKWWPEHIDTSWVGRRIVHRESGEVCTLGHLSSYGWYVHVPLQGTWRFSEQDLFRLFIPAPPEKDELSNIAYSTVKPRDVHQETADQLGITREEAKVRNFASLYGSKEPFTKYPLQGFSKLGKKDPKQG